MRRRKKPYLTLEKTVETVPEYIETAVIIGLTGYSGRASLADAVKNGRFPPPVKVGRRAVRWRTVDVLPFITGGVD